MQTRVGPGYAAVLLLLTVCCSAVQHAAAAGKPPVASYTTSQSPTPGQLAAKGSPQTEAQQQEVAAAAAAATGPLSNSSNALQEIPAAAAPEQANTAGRCSYRQEPATGAKFTCFLEVYGYGDRDPGTSCLAAMLMRMVVGMMNLVSSTDLQIWCVPCNSCRPQQLAVAALLEAPYGHGSFVLSTCAFLVQAGLASVGCALCCACRCEVPVPELQLTHSPRQQATNWSPTC